MEGGWRGWLRQGSAGHHHLRAEQSRPPNRGLGRTGYAAKPEDDDNDNVNLLHEQVIHLHPNPGCTACSRLNP